jgi:hypothetical protein
MLTASVLATGVGDGYIDLRVQELMQGPVLSITHVHHCWGQDTVGTQ